MLSFSSYFQFRRRFPDFNGFQCWQTRILLPVISFFSFYICSILEGWVFLLFHQLVRMQQLSIMDPMQKHVLNLIQIASTYLILEHRCVIHFNSFDSNPCKHTMDSQCNFNLSCMYFNFVSDMVLVLVKYLDGTTDITRTVHFGKPSAHEKACYTAVCGTS